MPSSKSTKVKFFFDGVTVNVKHRNLLKKFIESIFSNEKKKLETINYIFCTDEKLRTINKNYLNHNYYTDIITFDFSETKNSIIGEVYISVDRVRENALNFQESFKKELQRVVFHGALHLCGYKDKGKWIPVMRKKEDQYLNKYKAFVSRNTVSA